MNKETIAEKIFKGHHAKIQLEDELDDAGVPFEETGYDEYDDSIELFDVSDDYRLSPEAQQILFNAGFSIVYLNHKNKWETHYKFYKDKELPLKGWRVSYPHKRNDGTKGILVEEPINSWPQEWFKTGYAKVVEVKENI